MQGFDIAVAEVELLKLNEGTLEAIAS